MPRPATADPPPRDRWLHGLLAATVVLPALAFAYGTEGGRVAFVLYREPKLAAVQVLGWTLLAALAWRRPEAVDPRAVTRLLKGPVPGLAVVLLAWMAMGVLWVEVPANLFYELHQYALLVALLLALLLWREVDPRVDRTLLVALVAGFAPLTLLGLLQLAVSLPWLAPIDPALGVRNPSLMGYKNPMALALVGQIFLLAHLATRPAPRDGSARRIVWIVLGACELVYLATLHSRTAYLALVAGGLLAAVLAVSRRRSPRAVAWAAAVVVAAGGLFAAGLALAPGGGERLRSAVGFVASPGTFLASDRGVYLRNTVHMVADQPFGVGLGDWQTQYPLYRRYDRYRAFTETHQVRRAHGDHVQMLGELGWQGLAVWLALLVAAALGPLRRYLATGGSRALFAGVQVVTLAVAMAGDYVVEMPYHKFELFLVLVLAVAAAGPVAGEGPAADGAKEPPSRRRRIALALAVTALAAAGAAYAVGLGVKSYCAAALRRDFVELTEGRGGEPVTAGLGEAGAALLVRIDARGARCARIPGVTKTTYKDELIRAYVAWKLGDLPRARAFARSSLALHPYHLNAFRLLAVLDREGNPARAASYQETYRYLMDEVTDGFRRPYPPLPAD